mgnify:CR=1 FL=1
MQYRDDNGPEWTIEQRKQGNEVYVVSSKEGIFIGEGYDKEERARTNHLANIIVEALNKAEDEAYEHEMKEGWVCKHCGKSTFETDYEHLFSPQEHIGCALQEFDKVSKNSK